MSNIYLCDVRLVARKLILRINIILFAFSLSIIFYTISDFLFYVRENKFSLSSKVGIFHPLPPSNDDDNVHKTQDLIIRKYELDVPSNKAEAMNSLHVALEMKNAGKFDKAMKIIEHSLSLMPRDPDILNTYGEFLEYIQNDIIGADQKYYQALCRKPDHKSALINRQRTAIIVEEIDKISLKKIDDKRNKVAEIPENDLALCRAKKEAYFQHIYHTVGIEGNTMTLSQTRSIVETRMAIGGKSIAEHNEILGLDSALKYINSTLIDKLGQITVDDILEIHRRVLGYVDPMESGLFRRTQVFVGGYVPPGPTHIPLLMKEFINWLNSGKTFRLHPVQVSALAHYKLVHIHPFLDGNGRTSRLLMNMILMRAGFPPVIIPKQERHKYYEVLELANEGDIRPFIRFIAECTDKTLDLFLMSTKQYSTVNIPAIESDAV